MAKEPYGRALLMEKEPCERALLIYMVIIGFRVPY
jgi:hypothetical protein